MNPPHSSRLGNGIERSERDPSRAPFLTTDIIEQARPPRHPVSADNAYAALAEMELSSRGRLESVATLFLTNRECPFRCLMCDLWKHTLTERVPVGAIPRQIRAALATLPECRHVKLYNSGNFFDAQAIPPEDHAEIARIIDGFETVIVENHPRLCGGRCVEFRDRLSGELEVAIGLETTHPDVLPRLNKQMTVDDYDRACEFLRKHSIAIRTFVLLQPPFLFGEAAIDACLATLEHAFRAGSRVCSVIPTRAGNGIMEQLERAGWYSPPELTALERVCEIALGWQGGRVFADLWDAGRFSRCDACLPARLSRLEEMNRTQSVPPRVECGACRNGDQEA